MTEKLTEVKAGDFTHTKEPICGYGQKGSTEDPKTPGGEKPEKMLEYIRIYADNMESPDEKDTQSKKARKLLRYLENNRHGLLPYDRQEIPIPEAPERILYKHIAPVIYFMESARLQNSSSLISVAKRRSRS